MNIFGTFDIDRPAKSKGGDRYKGQLSNDVHSELSTVYIPQTISRDNQNEPYRRFKIKMLSKMDETGLQIPRDDCVMVSCYLKKAAKSGGGDRYDGKVNDEMLSVYISQCFSRVRNSKLKSNAVPVKEARVIFLPVISPPISSSIQVLSSPLISINRQTASEAASFLKRERPSTSEHDQVIPKRGRNNLFIIDVDANDCETKSRNDQSITKRGNLDRIVIGLDDDECEAKSSNQNIATLNHEHAEKTIPQGVDLKAYLHEQYDDSIIKKISDSSGNFSLDTYLKIRMAGEEFF